MPSKDQNVYSRIIQEIFKHHYTVGSREVPFLRDELTSTAIKLSLDPPKNLGDVIYTFRFRQQLPDSIQSTSEEGHIWIIRLAGPGKYKFGMVKNRQLAPNPSLQARKIPNSTPGLISKYALTDEQALLAIVRYNRLVDIFTGITCYSLQNHLRTTVENVGQIETDEIYVGVDKAGVQYVIPVQAKTGRDKLGVVQTEQDLAMCEDKFPGAVCLPISAQFMKDDVIALFQLSVDVDGVLIANERHYRLVSANEILADELAGYRIGE